MPKGSKWLRNHRKTAKNHAKKDWRNKENIIFLWLRRVSKTGWILSEKGRVGISAFTFHAQYGRSGDYVVDGKFQHCQMTTSLQQCRISWTFQFQILPNLYYKLYKNYLHYLQALLWVLEALLPKIAILDWNSRAWTPPSYPYSPAE